MSAMKGLTTWPFSLNPTVTAPTGPEKGMLLMARAADAAIIDNGPGSLIMSIEKVVTMIWTSLK